MSTKAVVLPIQGSTCASCVVHEEPAVHEVDGMLSASVNPGTERATVELAAGVATLADWKRAVVDAGCGVRETADMNVLVAAGTRTACLYSVAVTFAPQIIPEAWPRSVAILLA